MYLTSYIHAENQETMVPKSMYGIKSLVTRFLKKYVVQPYPEIKINP